MKKKIIIANWKMNPRSLKEAEKLFSAVARSVNRVKKTQVIICPPFVYLEKLKKISKKVSIGAQDSFGLDVGPFTGEVSPHMLYDMGARYVILGHSERRELGETNEFINKKIKGALSAGLTVVICVGEKERDQNHEYFNIVKKQLGECLSGISKTAIPKIVIAYEPVWAISSTENRRDATPKDCEEMVIFIKKVLSDKFGAKVKLPKIIYGGSVNTKDAASFLERGSAEGLLVGRASLTADKFIEIVKICEVSSK